MLELSGKMCGCISEEELLKNSEMESKTEKKNMSLPAGLHIESGWADEERREKNWAQLKHEEKVFDTKEKENKNVNDYVNGQLGFGT
tara:strand:+ start:50257 stop:50517 length:261 start_codon:yes stop_codon:yes gene_type:complete